MRKRHLSVLTITILALLLALGISTVGADHTPEPTSVTIVGSLQEELGCPGDWQPECTSTYLAFDAEDDLWQQTFTIPTGAWEYKAALNDAWDENYGANAVLNGANITLNLTTATDVKFYYSHDTHWVTDNANSTIATATGSFQSELGCPDNWQPWCLRSWLQDPDGDGTYEFATVDIPVGNYEFKVALDEDWAVSYPTSNVAFTTMGDELVTFIYDAATNDVSFTVEPAPPPGPDSVTIVGSLQTELGCPADWDPACADTHLAYDASDDVWQQIFSLPTGDYEYKAALDDSWDENYGANAQLNGPNIPLAVAAGPDVKFYYDDKTHWVTDNINSTIATAAGSFQDEIGCPGDWQPDCLRSWLQDINATGVYSFTTTTIPAGDYEFKVALDEAWDTSYPANNVPFTVPTDGLAVTFTYDTAGNQVSVVVEFTEVPPEIADLVTPPVRDPNQDEVFYFVMPDRFDDGDPTNNTGGIAGTRLDHGFDPTDSGFYHGGDIAGLEDHLDYLDELGITALWMTPIFTNNPVQGSGVFISAGYHGYWIVDMTQTDPHLGDNAELEALINAAHARGMKVFFDIITNHTADAIAYAEGTYNYRNKTDYPYRDADGNEFDDRDYVGTGTFPDLDPDISFPYTPFTDTLSTSHKSPPWLNDLTYYHNRGDSSFAGESSLYGDFFGLDDLFTEHPDVVDGMIDIYASWVADYEVDGFRVDTVKHVNLEFWQDFVPAIIDTANAVGRTEFFVFGEVFTGNPLLLSHYTTQADFPAVLDFRFQGHVRNYASQGGTSDNLRDLFANDDYFTDADSNVYALPTFIGNHDMGRFGYFLNADNAGQSDADLVARSELATAMMFFARGMPVIYYGDEQGFTGTGGDKDARQDMMPSQVPSYNANDLIGTNATTADANFDQTHPLYQTYSDFAAILAAHPTLATGAQIHRYSQGAAGIYAFSRIDRLQQLEYVVAFNNATTTQTAFVPTFSPNNFFGNIYPGSGSLTSDADGNVTIGLDPLSFAVYVAEIPIPPSDAAPGIAFTTLTNGQEVVLETQDLDGNAVQDRIEVGVDLTEDKWAEVTFAVRKSGTNDYTVIGVDDNAPYRVFFSLADVPGGFNDGDMLDFVAVVTDNAGNLSYAEVTNIAPVEPEEPGAGSAAYAILHYFRDDGDYGDHTTGDFNNYWGLHLWGDIEETITWTDPKPFLGEDDYGRFAWVKLAPNASNVGFIVHRGDTKDGTNDDRYFNPAATPEIWLRQDDANAYTSQAAAQGYVTIRYHRPDGDYGDPTSPDFNDFWGLHLWGDAIDPSEITDWPDPKRPTGFDDFGAYWEILLQDVSHPVNFIIHRGDAKDPGPDQAILPEEQATAWIVSMDETIYAQRGAAEGFITLHYHRPAGDYGDPTSPDFNDFWGLHTWGDADDPGWTTPRTPEYEDTFGFAYKVDLTGAMQEIGYILHRGDEKDPGPDQALNVGEWDYEVWQLQAEVPDVPNEPQFVYPLLLGAPGANPGDISQQRAYWVDATTILWEAGGNPDLTYTMHFTDTGGLEATDIGIIGGGSFTLTLGTLSPDTAARFPHLAHLPALELDGTGSYTETLTGQIAVSAVNTDGQSVDASGLQIPGVLDDLFTYEGELGISWNGDVPTFRVWAPTAQSVTFHLFPDADPTTAGITDTMELDPATGVWSLTADPGSGLLENDHPWYGQYYLYEVEVYVPSTDQVERNLVTDPYSFSLAMNSTRSQIVDLGDEALKPAGWDGTIKPPLVAPEDISIYEIHVRDFSVNDPNVPDDLQGTYKAFTLDGTNGMDHLEALQAAGLSHLHLLPVFDIATINENKSEWQEADWGDLATYPPDSEEQQALITQYEDLDGFNWGYDPFHYTTPEGSYATDPNGATRIVEFREMVQALNEQGLRVVMDVVYNHTNSSGQDEKSVLDRIVPGYYHRLDANGQVETSTCCQNTASEHNMMEKLMVDSLVIWAEQYKVDAFRFDLMGHHSLDNMLNVRAALDSLTLADNGVDGSAIYIYGEGWNFGEVADNARFVQATQLNLGGTGIGSFSDRLRDAVRGGGPFDSGDDLIRRQGFANGLFYDPNDMNSGSQAELDTLLLLTDQIRVGMAGNLAAYEFVDRNGDLVSGADVDYNGQPAGYTQDPQEDITYISKHDNQTLFDNNIYKVPLSVEMQERVRIQNVGLSTVLLGQGVPFMHAGSDLLRSKSLDRDSFNSGDWFNKIDFTYQANNFGVGLPVAGKNQDNWPIMQPLLADTTLQPGAADIAQTAGLFQELLAIRYSSELFRLETAEDIQERVVFHNTGPAQLPGLVVMSISDLSEPDLDLYNEMFVTFVNANDETQVFSQTEWIDAVFVLHPVQANSIDPVVRTATFDPATGAFEIPGRTTAVFVVQVSAQELIYDLIEDVEDLVDGGKLNRGQGNSLISKLENSLRALNNGRYEPAIKILNAFINELNAFIRGGTLPPEDGQHLIESAETIIVVIEGSQALLN